ncbi:S-protein homolog 1 [Linum grandiflorum]
MALALAVQAVAIIASIGLTSTVVNAAASKGSKDSVSEFTYIHIVNELGGGKSLTVHCKTKKHDLKIHDVTPKSEYQFKFKVSNTSSKTFECNLKNGKKEIVYKAYYEDAELMRRIKMNKCYWIAKDDGLYLRQDWRNTDTFWRPWP